MFSLSSSFSIFNDVVVLESHGTDIVFGSVRGIDAQVRSRLEKSCERFFRRNGGHGNVSFRQVGEEEFQRAVVRQYGSSGEWGKSQGSAEEIHGEAGKTALDSYVKDTVQLLDSVLKEAVGAGATDVHIEETRIRFRVGGRMRTVLALSRERHVELVRRIKVLSKLNVMEKRRAQDGAFVFRGGGQCAVFVRSSIVPSVSFEESESAVLRLLDPMRLPLELSRLGFSGRQLSALESMAQNENGLILISGPTGSGKSTTAASLLVEIGRMGGSSGESGKKIITIEDPVEYVLPEITQIAVNDGIGMGFAECLRRVFRQDPDVIFVGEIRDETTAQTVIRAALTGHLVIATVHTSGFYETMLRLTDLGCGWNELFSVLRGIVSQRLVDGNRLVAEVFSAGRDMFDSVRLEHGEVARNVFDELIRGECIPCDGGVDEKRAG